MKHFTEKLNTGLIKEAILVSIAIFFLVEIGIVASIDTDNSLLDHLKSIGGEIINFIKSLK